MSKKQSKEVRVEAIINAAIEEFLEKGYEGASVDAISKRAGVSKGGFYYHFSNKEVLLMEANKKISEPVETMAEKAFCEESPIKGLSNYIKEYLKYWVAKPKEMSFLFLSMSKAMESEILVDYYREYVNASTEFFTAMFLKAIEKGELEITDPEAYGVTLMGALDGVVSYAIVHSGEDMDQLAERFEKIWLFTEGRV